MQAALRSLAIVLVSQSLIPSMARAEQPRFTLSLRGGMANSIDSRYSRRFPSGYFPMLAIAQPMSERWSLLATAAYWRKTDYPDLVTIPEAHWARHDQIESLLPAALGLRFEPFRHSSQLGVFFEACPAFFWYHYELHTELDTWYDVDPLIRNESLDSFKPGLQLGLVAPGRLTSRLGWELGLFYLHAPGFEREGRTYLRGVNHFSFMGGFSIEI